MQQDRNFTIKINDFLKSTTISDSLEFRNKFSTKLPHITGGISCDILIQTGDDETVFVSLQNTTYSCEQSCDRCGKQKLQEFTLDDINLSCYADYPLDQLNEYEVSFSSKDGRIDLEETFIQEISLDLPIKILCTECQTMSTPINDESSVGNGIIRKT